MATATMAKTVTGQTAARFLAQWKFGPTTPPTPLGSKSKWDDKPTHTYTLYNTFEKRYLQHEEQTYGINLGWTDDASALTAKKVQRWFMTKHDNAGSPIHYGDVLALANGMDPSFIHNAHRTFGIDLEWSKTPVFEWQILGGPKGTPVMTGDSVALYNQHIEEPMIYFDRTVGGDIGWPSSETWSEIVYDWAAGFLKDHWKEGLGWLLAA